MPFFNNQMQIGTWNYPIAPISTTYTNRLVQWPLSGYLEILLPPIRDSYNVGPYWEYELFARYTMVGRSQFGANFILISGLITYSFGNFQVNQPTQTINGTILTDFISHTIGVGISFQNQITIPQIPYFWANPMTTYYPSSIEFIIQPKIVGTYIQEFNQIIKNSNLVNPYTGYQPYNIGMRSNLNIQNPETLEIFNLTLS